MKETLILCTADTTELAQKMARALVEENKAACVNIIPGMRSIYRWEGRICDESECLLVIKTTDDRFEAVRSRIRELHSYQVPEIIAVPVTAGDADYLAWLRGQIELEQ
jgi:periplasmic divalent cation tolerance protein